MHSEINMHSHKHSFHMFIIFINRNYGCRSKMDKITYLIRSRPTTNYIAATFHPTIGQRAPYSLSSAATPELGMILQGLRELAGLHIAKDIQNIAKTT